MNHKEVDKWTSSGKTFRVGDMGRFISQPHFSGIVTSIEVCDAGDGHVILDDNPNTLTDFRFLELDKSYYREIKLGELGI